MSANLLFIKRAYLRNVLLFQQTDIVLRLLRLCTSGLAFASGQNLYLFNPWLVSSQCCLSAGAADCFQNVRPMFLSQWQQQE